MNFSETLMLYKAFSTGRLRCSNVLPKIFERTHEHGQYDLIIKKNTTNKLCQHCIKDFAAKHNLSVTEKDGYFALQTALIYC
ncbi:MAG TPA: hypothetical protein VK209_02525 [Candidatus Sulfotelmatobacter sp.]|nr:hypothetical protein [Candidatus Sulfotelmatobacter sp.]